MERDSGNGKKYPKKSGFLKKKKEWLPKAMLRISVLSGHYAENCLIRSIRDLGRIYRGTQQHE